MWLFTSRFVQWPHVTLHGRLSIAQRILRAPQVKNSLGPPSPDRLRLSSVSDAALDDLNWFIDTSVGPVVQGDRSALGVRRRLSPTADPRVEAPHGDSDRSRFTTRLSACTISEETERASNRDVH